MIHIVDDDPQMRAATSFALAGQGYKTQIYASHEELLGQRRLQDGCVLLKWGMPGVDVREVVAALEERSGTNPVIGVGERATAAIAIGALRKGATDFLERPFDEAELIAAVERAMDLSREGALQGKRGAAARASLARLSPRKRQVLQGLVAGMSNKLIARRLNLSPRTVELHRASMMDELGLESLAEALRMALDAELTPLDETLLGADDFDETVESPAAPDEAPPAASGNPAPIFPSPIDLLEATTDAVLLIDQEWRFTYLNENARKMLCGDDDFIGMSLWDKYPLASTTRAWGELHRAAVDRQATRFEFYQPDLRSWLDVSVRPYKAGLLIAFRNVTEERCSSAQLELSNETLLQTLAAAGDGAWDWNIKTGQIAMSPEFLDRLGYGPRAFPHDFESFVHLVHPDDLPALTRSLKDHLDGRSASFRCEYRLRCLEGDWLWSLDRGRVVERHPVTGLPLRMVGTANDITDIKMAQQRAEAASERLALAQANAGVGLWELELHTRELRLCERSRLMHGLPRDRCEVLTEADWFGMVHPDDRESAAAKFQAHIETGESYQLKYRTTGSDGSIRWILGLGKAMRSADGEPVRFVGLNIDITGLTAIADHVDPTELVTNY